MDKKLIFGFFTLCLLISALLLAGCAAPKATERSTERLDIITETMQTATEAQAPAPLKVPEPAVPEFVPVQETVSPLQARTVSVSARNTPLREVLFTIAETANLNLVMDREIDTELPVTVNLKDMSIGDVLTTVLDSADYFYSVKGNILTVRATETRVFELGHPNVIQEYKIKTGGDILSGTSSSTSGAAESAVSGDVSIQSSSDTTSFHFWDAVEKSIDTLLRQPSVVQGKRITPVFTINRMTGTIIVTATKSDLQKVDTYITNLKMVLNRQVLIEARIVEVQLSDSLEYGIDWNAVVKWFGIDSTTIGTAGFTNVIESTSPYFQVNIIENNKFTALLKALQEQGDVRTLSNPRVNIMNGQTALLSVGRNTSFISRVETVTTSSEGSVPTTTFTVETNSVLSGIIFGLVPHINSEGEITLTITPIVSNLVELDEQSIGTSGNSVDIKLPTVDLREMTTTVKVLDGQMVIIGGLIDRKEKISENKVPILGSIPILGMAFKSVSKSDEKTELVIMLIPRIVS